MDALPMAQTDTPNPAPAAPLQTAPVAAPQQDPSLPASYLSDDDLPQSFLTNDDLAPPAAGSPSLAGRALRDMGTGAIEAPGQIARGGEMAVNELSHSAFDMAGWLNKHIVDLGQITYDTHGSANPLNWHVGYSSGMPDSNSLLIPDAAMPAQASSVTGGLVEGASQFAAGMMTAGKFLRGFGLVAEGAGATVLKSGAVMATTFDPHEQRLSNLVQNYPALQNPVTDFLQAKPEDGEALARAKAGLEGLGLGAATEGFLRGLSALRAHYAGDAPAAVDAIAPAKGVGTPDDAHLPPVVKPETTDVTHGLAADDPRLQGPGTAYKNPDGTYTLYRTREGDVPGQGELPLDGGPTPGGPLEQIEGNPEGAENGKASNANGTAPQAKKLVTMTPEDLDRIRELRGNVDNAYADGVGDPEFKPLNGINTDLIEHDGDLPAIMDTLRTYYRDAMDKATGGEPSADGVAQPVRSWDQVRANVDRLSDIIGDNPQLMMQRLSNMHGNLQNLDAEVRLHGDLLATVGDRLSTLARAVDDPMQPVPAEFANRGELLAAFGRQYELMGNVQAMYKGIQTNIARSLNAFKIGAKINPDLAAGMASGDDLFAGGVGNIQKLARRINAGGGSLNNLAKQTRPGFVPRFLNAVNEYWINSVLSGPKTHMANVIGNVMSGAVLPAERMMSGALRMGTQEGRNEFLEGGLHYVGMTLSLRDAIGGAWKALKMGDGILDGAHNPTADFGGPAITAAKMNLAKDSLSAQIVNGLGSVIRLPSRLLTSEDEFFKQLIYRSAIRARAMREGFQGGLWNDPANPTAFSDYVANALDASATTTGAATDPVAKSMAQYATFQNPLAAQTWSGAKTIGESLQGLSNAHPMLKMILPFVRTPTNMMRYAWDRTPVINLTRAQFFNDLAGKNGAAAQSQAAAKNMTGGVLWATALGYALDGTLTGAGPADKNASQALRATGWNPYSFKTKNPDGSTSYRAYDRLDPFGTIFGLASDFAEVAAAHPEKDVENTAMAMVAALAKNIENKTYVSGLTRALAALGDPDKRGPGALQGLLGGFVPSFLRQTLLNDPAMREARTLVDGMRARTPGYSTQLDPVRNVLGAVVNQSPTYGPEWLSPVAQTQHPAGAQPVSPDWRHTVQARPEDELARLMYDQGDAITPPPQKDGTLDLTQVRSTATGKTVYDRLQELTGTVQIGGKNLHDQLADVISSPAYNNVLTDGDTLGHGSRLSVMQKWIGAYRKEARLSLSQEQPEMGEAFRQQTLHKAILRFQQPAQ